MQFDFQPKKNGIIFVFMSNCFFAQTVPVSHFKRKPTQRSVFELFPKESDNIKVSTSRAIDGLRGENAVKLFAIGGGGVKKMAIKKKQPL